MSLRVALGPRSLVLAILLIGIPVMASATASACTCDEICRPGEVYSDEHETCVGGEETADEDTEKPTS